jgi:hypothetical protein
MTACVRRFFTLDTYVPVAALICIHMFMRWGSVFGQSIENSKTYTILVIFLVLLPCLFAMRQFSNSRFVYRLFTAALLPYFASVISYCLVMMFTGVQNGNFRSEVLIVMWFFPFGASGLWLVSIYSLVWVVIDQYRIKKNTL